MIGRGRERQRQTEGSQGQGRECGAVGYKNRAIANLAQILSRFCARALLTEMKPSVGPTIPLPLFIP